jgi:hypothetical protein
MTSVLRRGAVAVALFVIAMVYGCDAGHGFVKDDFVWIANSRVNSPGDIVRLIAPGAAGFFRPIVSLTFSIDHALFGLDPLGYGLTNVALLFACIGLLFLVLNALGLRAGVAIGGALVWALNFQAVNMAVLWISGRTALVLVLWATAAAYAWVRGQRLLAALFAMLAMWSKEEGFVIPAILSVWSLIDSGRDAALPLGARMRRVLADTWMLWVVAAVSLAVRAWSGAWTPASAPSFYRYQFDLSTLLGHTYQYADRSATTPVLVFVVFWLVAGCPRISQGTDGRRRLKGASWLVLGFLPTLLLPVRSSLYALFPSIGAVIVLSDLVEGAASRLTPRALNRAIAFLVLLLVALFPVYKVRNRRYVREAELSAAVMREVTTVGGERGRTVVVIRDVRDARPTAEQAFGGLADEAGALMTDGRVRLWIEPPPADLAGGTAPAPTDVSAVLVVKSGQVTRIQ